ncbi:HNH endonuclease [Listeria booriae]|uniref:Putative HNH nuclease YajD n=1 Tax=Listeria booriae TaxID=1552123 RepID=A0A842AHS8_9LIST|nr:HNH endonuclease signature motif containing protein [Listeria booriae]MBC1616414.1 HNH endonuclease [Listeria booriae]
MTTAEIVRMTLLGDMTRFYNSKAWKNVRAEARRRDNNECQLCKEEGKHSKCEAVHHIKEVREHPELALVLSNLVCVCKVHHNREHPEKLQKQKKKFENEERW